VNGRVTMYAAGVTPAMKNAMDETERRRIVQRAYNEKHGIIPQTVVRAVMNINPAAGTIDYLNVPKLSKSTGAAAGHADAGNDVQERIAAMRLEMFAAAENLDFEKAARLRDELQKLQAVAGTDAGGNADRAVFDPYESNGRRKSGVRARGTAKAEAPSTSRSRRYKTR
jgi:excinuclease ABC subunit B